MSMQTLPWHGWEARAEVTTQRRPAEPNWTMIILRLALCLMLFGQIASVALNAQNLGTQPAFNKAVQGQQAATVEDTVLNIVNWGCNVIAPIVGIACLGIAGWHRCVL